MNKYHGPNQKEGITKFGTGQFFSTQFHEQDQYVWQKCQTHYKPILFVSSMIKREPTWLHLEELKNQKQKERKKKNCFKILIEQPTKPGDESIYTLSTFSSLLVRAPDL